MYLYLGGEAAVWEEAIVGVFDLDNTTVSKATRGFLSRAQKEGTVLAVTADLPKSFCVAESGGRETVYISPVSPATVKKRAGEALGTHIK